MYKVIDNFGNGFDSLYGTRNMRTVLHGVAYRGGANNYYHKTDKRNNHNPLPDDGIANLCKEGFSHSIYLYKQNWDSAPEYETCDCVNEAQNEMEYSQYDYYDKEHIKEMLGLDLQKCYRSKYRSRIFALLEWLACFWFYLCSNFKTVLWVF